MDIKTLLSNSYYTKEKIKCPICLEENENNLCRRLKCGHSFHCECIDKWFVNNKTCPICRFNLINLQIEEEEKIIDVRNIFPYMMLGYFIYNQKFNNFSKGFVVGGTVGTFFGMISTVGLLILSFHRPLFPVN